MTTPTPFDNEQYNPFAAPESLDHAKDSMGTDAERIRSALIGHEASIQSIGFLYILGSIFAVLFGIVVTLSASQAMAVGRPATELSIALGTAAFFLGIGLGIVGFGLRHLKSWARIPVGVISGLGLIAVPIGTIINGYFLYLIFSEKGNRVFSPEYQEIIRQTPHIKYRTSIITKILLVLLLIFVGLITLTAFLGW
jgi:hypothetical protein